jgi:hypothetical protein
MRGHKDSFRKYQKTSITGNYYGYLWWYKIYQVNGKREETYYCSGNGATKFLFFPVPDLSLSLRHKLTISLMPIHKWIRSWRSIYYQPY